MSPALLALVLMPQSTALDLYVGKSDPKFSVGVPKRVGRRQEWTLTSQTWQGQAWTHKLTLVEPEKPGRTDTAILIVTGNEVERDHREAASLADKSGLPVATLFNVPNQPLWGMTEDALIAHTFVKWFETGDDTWPLLLPMTKSAIRAMDALGNAAGLKRFVVTGASKRGWTTWLTAATRDPRVIGIAPAVFDFLNFPVQLEHQKRTLGKYSEMIGDYTAQDLQQTVDSPEGKRLVSIVDPHAYLGRIEVPKLILLGANDLYWSTDALRLYWGDLKGPKWSLSVPNAGHNLGDGKLAEATLAAFASALSSGGSLPAFSAKAGNWFGTGKAEGSLQFEAGAKPLQVRVHRALSPDQDFRNDTWEVVARENPSGAKGAVRVSHPGTSHAAYILEAVFEESGRRFSLTSVPIVVPIRYR